MWLPNTSTPSPTVPIIRTPGPAPAVDPQFWGMNIELAAGMVGLVGALIGAAIGAIVTSRVAMRQQMHERRMAADARVRERAAVALTSVTRLAVAASKGDVTAQQLYDFQESTTLLMAEAAPGEPGLQRFIADAYVSVIEEAGIGVGRAIEAHLALFPEGLPWKDLWSLAMTTREGILGWLSGKEMNPDFNLALGHWVSVQPR